MWKDLSDDRLRELATELLELRSEVNRLRVYSRDVCDELESERAKLAAQKEGMPELGRALMESHDDWKSGYQAGVRDAKAAGPVMPEVPSEAIWMIIQNIRFASGDPERIYSAIRAALAKVPR